MMPESIALALASARQPSKNHADFSQHRLERAMRTTEPSQRTKKVISSPLYGQHQQMA